MERPGACHYSKDLCYASPMRRNFWIGSLALVLAPRLATAAGDPRAGATPPPAASASSASGAPTPSGPADQPIEVTVKGHRPGGEPGAASEVHAGHRELELRPRLRPGDVLEAVPGLFAVQHAGGGKANQYFLRGFDADHGTDIAFSVDGVPINMPSHGHGQGYSDFHFLIPELVVSLDGYKGPYYAELGDFDTAGAVDLHMAEKLPESYAQYTIGQYGIMRGLVAASPDLGDAWRTVIAADLYKDDGPFENPERLQRYSTYARVTHDLSPRGKLALTWMSYGSSWHGSGQIPARAVCGEGEAGVPPPSAYGQPCIDHFGAVDPSEGGATQRHMASADYSIIGKDADLRALAYLIKYRFTLYSNFTFFLDDPLNGDEIEQDDDRVVAGGKFRVRQHARIGSARLTTSFGVQARADEIANALYHDRSRHRLQARVDAGISESEIGVYVEEDARLLDFLRVVLGLRGQRADVAVDDHLGVQPTKTSGEKGASLLLPKAMIVLSPVRALDLFLDVGRGFHSNDARGVVLGQNAATLLTPAMGYEVGVRVVPLRGLDLRADAFVLDLDSELVWSGDSGGTEASGRTRRVGTELGARYHISNWLFADADGTLTRARFRENAGNAGSVALAPTRTLTAGLGVSPTFGAFTPMGSVRVKAIGSRPATPDGSLVAEGFTVVDATAGLRWKDIEAGLDVQNLLDARWREVQFATTSRLAYEPAQVTGIHYTPGWPRTVMARLRLYVR